MSQTSGSPAIGLNEAQRSVAEASPEARLLVTAGPGTGKTHTLIARIGVLIDRFGLSPGSEILALSFSRAAVREIRQRTAAFGGDVRYVRALTFDSFATQLLSECDPDGGWTSGDFDARIQCAVELLRRDPVAKDQLSHVGHVLVDELQDLVGVRADLVKEILNSMDGGFTLFGDPAQGIYNFQLQGPARVEGSAVLYRWVRQRFGDTLEEHTIQENQRALTAAAKRALPFGARLNEDSADFEQIRYDLRTLMYELPLFGNLDSCAGQLHGLPGRTAVLCLNNGQALMISRALQEVGTAHVLQRSATERSVPQWVAIVLEGLEHTRIGKSSFAKRVEDAGIALSSEVAWRLIKRAEGARGDSLELARLAARLAAGNIPDDLSERSAEPLTISTVHRAKGLEFDRVLVTDGRAPLDDEERWTAAEEARVLYVALTRPRKELYFLKTPPYSTIRLDRSADRWYGCLNRWRITDFEIRGDDVHSQDPAGGWKLAGCDARGTQEYLREQVRPGDLALFRKTAEVDPVSGAPLYAVEHEHRRIGVTSESFCWALRRLLMRAHRGRARWPDLIDGLRIECVETAAGSVASAERCGLGSVPVWLKPRIVGMGRTLFGPKE